MKASSRFAEQVERSALRQLHEAAPPSLRRRLGLHLEEIDGALVCIASTDPSVVLNRTVGLGVGTAGSPSSIQHIAACYRRHGVGRYYVHLHPQANPATLREWLLDAGFEKSRGWMKFLRRSEPTPSATRSDLEVRRIGEEHAADFGRIVAEGFGLQPGSAELLASLVGGDAWRPFVAFDGETPAAAAALFLHGGAAWFDWAATLPSFRRRGAQSLLLRARIETALAEGCALMFTATGEAVEGDPQHSYRNILRAGFRPDVLRENFVPV